MDGTLQFSCLLHDFVQCFRDGNVGETGKRCFQIVVAIFLSRFLRRNILFEALEYCRNKEKKNKEKRREWDRFLKNDRYNCIIRVVRFS